MKTFNNYLEQKLLEEAAQKIVDLNLDADVFLKEWFEENHPEVAEILNENWWQGVKDAAGQVWQGAKAGVQSFNRAAFGPEAKFNAARSSLQGLLDYVNKDPQLVNWLKRPQGQTFSNELNGIIGGLDKLQRFLPRNLNQTASNSWQNTATNNAWRNAPQNWRNNVGPGAQGAQTNQAHPAQANQPQP